MGQNLIPPGSRRIAMVVAVVGLIGIMEVAMLLSARQESQTSDEAYSLFAGYLHLTAGDFSICPAYPPLTKDVAALPLLALRPYVPPMTDSEASDFRGGRIFLYSNRATRLLFAARTAMTIFPLVLGVLVFIAAKEMFGTGPAIVSLVLIVFDPNLLAHGPLITNDVALACCLFAAVYAFWRYVRSPNAWRLLLSGFAGGLTLAAKHSGIILFPILFLAILAELLIPAGAADDSAATNPPAREKQRHALRLLAALAAVGAISLIVLWGFYCFRYSARPGTEASPASLAPLLAGVQSRAVRAGITLAARFHLLPESFLEGLAFFYDTASRPTYLLGTRYLHGVWFYFPTAMTIKSTLGFLLLLVVAPFAGLLREREKRREVWWMLIPAAVYLVASMTSNLDIGIRHILPVYVFLCVVVAAGAWRLGQRNRAWQVVVVCLLIFHAASSLRAYPNYLAYSNELWGGPSKTYRVLTDSNVDWGQGLPAVKRYLDAHDAAPCWLAYFGTVDPAYYDIPCKIMTSHTAVVWERPLEEIPEVIHGTVLVSATEMSGQAWGPDGLNPYEQFRTARPVACLAGSILVYKGTFRVPLASALSRLWIVMSLASRGDFERALEEAHQAEALAPQSVDVQFAMARVLEAAGRKDEARQALERGLRLALTIHPEAQTYWIPVIGRELAGLERSQPPPQE